MSDSDVRDSHSHHAIEQHRAVPSQSWTYKHHVAQRARQGCPIPGSDDELRDPAARGTVAQDHSSTASHLCFPHVPRSADCTRGAPLACEEVIRCCDCDEARPAYFSNRTRQRVHELSVGLPRRPKAVRCISCTDAFVKHNEESQQRKAGDLGAQCCECHRWFLLSDFSTSQRKKPTDSRRCLACSKQRESLRAQMLQRSRLDIVPLSHEAAEELGATVDVAPADAVI